MVNKRPHPTDLHVGSRVRLRRKLLGMSQARLGAALGITFQQVQKYEKGTNRIGASRLQHMAEVLHVPVPFFFDGAPGPRNVARKADPARYVSDFLNAEDSHALANAFMRLPSGPLRRSIVVMVERIADSPKR